MDAAAIRKTIFEWKFSPMATYICPSFRATRNESNAPRGLAFLLSLTEGPQQRPYDSVLVERLYQCSSCYLCNSLGYDDTDPALLFIHARKEAIRRGLVPQSVERYKAHLTTRPETSPLASYRSSSSTGKGKRDVGLVVDPMIAADFPGEIGACVDLLSKLGSDVEVVDAPRGSGAQLFALGYWNEAAASARELIEAVKSGGFGTLVFLSPYDFKAWTSWYATIEVKKPDGVTVAPFPVYVQKLLESGKVRLKEKKVAVTYVDAGHFVRPTPIFGSIAELLSRVPGVEFLPTWRAGRLADTDAGDFLPAIYPKIADRIDEILLESVRETGATVVLTSCFYTLRNLRRALSRSSDKGAKDLQTQDLGSFLRDVVN